VLESTSIEDSEADVVESNGGLWTLKSTSPARDFGVQIPAELRSYAGHSDDDLTPDAGYVQYSSTPPPPSSSRTIRATSARAGTIRKP
jgi:hypothetical protein